MYNYNNHFACVTYIAYTCTCMYLRKLYHYSGLSELVKYIKNVQAKVQSTNQQEETINNISVLPTLVGNNHYSDDLTTSQIKHTCTCI